MSATPAERLIDSVAAMKPDLAWALDEAHALRGEFVWLAFCGVEYDYADAMRRIETVETAINDLLEGLARLNR